MKPTVNCSISVVVLLIFLALEAGESRSQTNPISVRVAYSALSAGIGILWLTHEQGIFRQYGVESNLVYMRSGTTAAQALLAGEIQFGHLSPAPMMTAWAQGADIAWVGTTIHQMVFTLITDANIAKGVDSRERNWALLASVRQATSPCAPLWNILGSASRMLP
jgi:ABC-type nitrate/sulfonate/bicarbonate transport system substrate-binding protein